MDNVITINNTKKNTLEFDVSIQGLDTKDVDVKFVIKTKGMDLAFAAKHDKGDTWSVTIPELPMVEKTTYKCHVCVVADGYYFEPMKGTVNIVGSHEIYTTTPKNVTLEPDDKKKEEKKDTSKDKKPVKESSPYTKSREKPIEQIARELMDAARSEVSAPKSSPVPKPITESHIEQSPAVEPVSPTAENDKKVLEVLESVGFQPRKKKRSFSLQ